MIINFKNSMSDPFAIDIGNKTLQGKTESKTMKFALFTTNDNAVWAARNQLRKESYPLKTISIPVNRNAFRLQVGDVFKFSYSKYSITDMILRVLSVEENNLNSENITLHCIEDFFSVTNAYIEADLDAPPDNTIQPPDYSTESFDTVDVVESPYVLSTTEDTNSFQIIPVASKQNDFDNGFSVYMSIDDGASYKLIDSSSNIQPYGTLNTAYPVTYTIDEDTGIIIDFESGTSLLESTTWANVYSGTKNTALLGDEIISFKDVTPITSTQYKLENVIRGRYGTTKKAHSALEDFWVIGKGIDVFGSSEILPGATRKFKLVPYNIKFSGDIADATAITLDIEGQRKKPYPPINFNAEGESFNPTYTSGADITLTWSPRLKDEGAGIGIPGSEMTVSTDHEGLFEIETWVGTAEVRTTSAIDAITWDYTDAMNVADNGSSGADTITFKLTNYLTENSKTYESEQVEVTINKE